MQLVVGKYELIELVGEGGMASVWRSQMRGAAGFSRAVAVKKIKSEFRAIRNYIDMFIEEARVGSDLNHPNIVQVFDFCSDEEGSYYLVMEWVDGLDLGRVIRAYREAGQLMPWHLVAAIGVAGLRGLHAAHERVHPDGSPAPVIHRDISPHNLLLGINGIVKVTDFGLARARDRAFSLTAPGTVKGKLSYLAPETTYGKPASPHSDMFALGSVLWESLTGRRLFEGPTDAEVFKKIRNCEVPPLLPLRPDLPRGLAEIIAVSLKKEPENRFVSARAMATALADVLRSNAVSSDAQQDLGEAVRDARLRLGGKLPIRTDLPTVDWQADAPKKSQPPVTPGLPIDRRGIADSVEIDFSTAELGADPLSLSGRKDT